MFQVETLETRRKMGIYALAGTALLAMINAVSADSDTCLWRNGQAGTSGCISHGASFLDEANAPYLRAGTLIGSTIFADDGTPMAKITDFVFDRNNRLQDVIVTSIVAAPLGDRADAVYAIDARAMQVKASAATPDGSESTSTDSVLATGFRVEFQADKKAFTPFRYDWNIQSAPKHIDAIAVDEVTFSSLTSAYVINRDGEVLGSAGDLLIDPAGHIGYVLLDAMQSGKRVAVAYRPLPATDTNDIILDIDRTDLKTAPDFDPQRALRDAV